ncbi:MAG: type I methionyl aminopeptidase [Planctomycetota bacterium]
MPPIPVVQGKDAEAAAEAAQRVVQVHTRLAESVCVGQTLAQIDTFIADTLEDLGCKSCFLGYRAPKLPKFPSHACLSLNDCIVHGTAGYTNEPLKPGDLLSIDIGVSYRGWIGDAAWTYAIADRSEQAERLMRAGMDSIQRGIAELQPGAKLLNWAAAVQETVETEAGFHLTRGLGGHGYGRTLHAPPFVANVVPANGFLGEWPDARLELKPGTLIAVEPMIAVGTGRTTSAPKTWPIFSADGSLAVHYEHDVLVTEDGPRVLTEGLDDLPEVIG